MSAHHENRTIGTDGVAGEHVEGRHCHLVEDDVHGEVVSRRSLQECVVRSTFAIGGVVRATFPNRGTTTHDESLVHEP